MTVVKTTSVAGVFDTGTPTCNDLLPLVNQLPPSTHDTDTPVGLVWRDGEMVACVYNGEEMEEVGAEQMGQEQLEAETTLVRVRGRLNVVCAQNEGELANAFRHLIEKVFMSLTM